MQYARPLRRSLLSLTILSAFVAPALATNPTQAQHVLLGAAPGGAFGAYLAGRFAEKQGNVGYAAQELLDASRADPTNMLLRRQAFVAAVLAGRREALALARQLPGNAAAELYLADAAAAAGRWSEAGLHFRAVSAPASPVASVAPLLVAWAEQGQGDTDAALATLQPLLRSDQFRAVYALHAALIADLGGRAADADRYYRLAQTTYAGTNLRLTQILASWQARRGDLAGVAATFTQLAQANRALGIVVPALTANAVERPVASATDGLAETYLALAASLRPQESSEFAQLLLRLALDLRPSLTAARLLIADLLQTADRPAQALAALDPIPASDPLHGLVVLRRAGLEQALGRKDEAMRDLEALAREYPSSPEPLIQQGDLLRTESRFAEAVDAYDEALARIGKPRPADWSIFYARAIAYDRSHQWDKAEADLQQALRLSPDESYVMNYLAYSWAEQGRNLDTAKQLLDRAAELKPNDGAILDSMGWVLMRQGNTEEAIRWLERAVEADSEDATINAHLGDAYWAAGRRLQAQFQWRRALTLNPEPADAAKLEAKLRQSASAVIKPATATSQVQ
jgi:tetratricopeptide (TPR) repeat protein